METEWEEGVWLGHARCSNEAIIGTGVGVVRAYAIRRQAEGQRWSGERIKEMQGTPQQPNPGRQSIEVSVRIDVHKLDDEEEEEEEMVDEAGVKKRRRRITKKAL